MNLKGMTGTTWQCPLQRAIGTEWQGEKGADYHFLLCDSVPPALTQEYTGVL